MRISDWSSDVCSTVLAEFYLDTIKTVFQDYQLPRGSWQVDCQTVNPAAIKNVALFTIEGEFDDISGQGQTQAAHELCSSIPKNLRRPIGRASCRERVCQHA